MNSTVLSTRRVTCFSLQIQMNSFSLSNYHWVLRTQHINFCHSHLPKTIILKCPFGIPRTNFPEFAESAFCLAFLSSLLGNPSLPRNFRAFPWRGLKLICWAAVTTGDRMITILTFIIPDNYFRYIIRWKPKGDGGKGTGKKRHDNLHLISCHEMSRQFATNVTTIYDIFCPVPFLPSPFGFHRVVACVSQCTQEKVRGNYYWTI